MKRVVRLSIVLVSLAVGIQVAVADADAVTDKAKVARAKELLEHMQGIRMEVVGDKNRESVPLIEHALLSYTDPVRANVNGSVWAWGREGRPVALVEVFQPASEKQWIHAITQTSTERISANVSVQQRWSPTSSALQFQSIPATPSPAERDVMRLGQLKDLARKFEAHEFWDPDNSRFELRLLVQPIHRYRDTDRQIMDGAIFLFAHGTNPEIALLIEAQGKTVAASEWCFAVAPLGSAELHVELNGKDVWQQPRAPGVTGKPTDPYWLFFTEHKHKDPLP